MYPADAAQFSNYEAGSKITVKRSSLPISPMMVPLMTLSWNRSREWLVELSRLVRVSPAGTYPLHGAD